MSTKPIIPVGSLVLVGLVLALMLLTWILVKPPSPPAELQGVLRPEFRTLAAFHLSSASRGPVTESSLRGKWSFFFFGYLSCPDVCPATMHELGRFWALFADEREAEPEDLQVIFVSVDPARDSTEKLERYVSYFNRSFIGATAGKGQIDRLTRQFSAGYLLEPETSPGNYLVSHSSAVFLVDPYGRVVASFSQPHHATTILAQFKKIRDYYGTTGRLEARDPDSVILPVGFFPLATGPDCESDQQHDVNHEADREKADQRFARAGVGIRGDELGLCDRFWVQSG